MNPLLLSGRVGSPILGASHLPIVQIYVLLKMPGLHELIGAYLRLFLTAKVAQFLLCHRGHWRPKHE
nr:hypothetical protein [Runella sp.]